MVMISSLCIHKEPVLLLNESLNYYSVIKKGRHAETAKKKKDLSKKPPVRSVRRFVSSPTAVASCLSCCTSCAAWNTNIYDHTEKPAVRAA